MNLNNEIDYRILLMVVSNLFDNKQISKNERDITIKKLVDKFKPPFGEMEYDAYAEKESL